MFSNRMSVGLVNGVGSGEGGNTCSCAAMALRGQIARALLLVGVVLGLQAGGSVWAGASILLSPPGPSINAAAGQVIDVALVNNDAIQYDLSGITFVVKVGDGVSSGPTIDSIDLVGAGLFFEGNGQTPVGGGNDRTKAETAFSFSDVTLSASQTATLARITLNATGTLGDFDISFKEPNLLNQTTIVQGSNAPALTLQDGVITVVPEPATYYAVFSLLTFGAVFWRRRSKNA